MADLHDTLRGLLGLGEGVILSQEEMDYAVTKAPQEDQNKLRLAIIHERIGREETLKAHNLSTGSKAGLRVPGDETGSA